MYRDDIIDHFFLIWTPHPYNNNLKSSIIYLCIKAHCSNHRPKVKKNVLYKIWFYFTKMIQFPEFSWRCYDFVAWTLNKYLDSNQFQLKTTTEALATSMAQITSSALSTERVFTFRSKNVFSPKTNSKCRMERGNFPLLGWKSKQPMKGQYQVLFITPQRSPVASKPKFITLRLKFRTLWSTKAMKKRAATLYRTGEVGICHWLSCTVNGRRRLGRQMSVGWICSHARVESIMCGEA